MGSSEGSRGPGFASSREKAENAAWMLERGGHRWKCMEAAAY